MNLARWSIIVCVICAGHACSAQSPPAQSARQTAADINALLDKARAATTVEEAQQNLLEAQRLLSEKNIRLTPLEQGFLLATIAQTRGRAYTNSWRRNMSRSEHRRRAERILTETVHHYERLQEQASQRADDIEFKLGLNQPEENPHYRAAVAFINQADYEQAWTHYTLGLVTLNVQSRNHHFSEAIDRFSLFTANGYRAHSVIASCFLGQALCLYEQQRYFDVIATLDPAIITPTNSQHSTFRTMMLLRIRACRLLPSALELENTARYYFATLPEGHLLNEVELRMLIERARALATLAENPDQNPYYRSFQTSLNDVAKLLYSYGDPWRGQLAAIMSDTSVLGRLTRARDHFQTGRYEQALAQATAAIPHAAQQGQNSLIADLRYIRVVSCWNLTRWLGTYQYATEFVKEHPKDQRANAVCGFAVQAGLAAMREEPPLDSATFLGFLDTLENQPSDNPAVAKAPWYRALLLLELERYAQAERILANIPDGSPIRSHLLYARSLAAC